MPERRTLEGYNEAGRKYLMAQGWRLIDKFIGASARTRAEAFGCHLKRQGNEVRLIEHYEYDEIWARTLKET